MESEKLEVDYSRFNNLHWVLKVGNLKKSVEFLEKCLGLKVLRHEEFGEKCEAGCNGKYNSPWSKTMMGYGPEKENFALELTYNYRHTSYQKGNDLQYISVEGEWTQVVEQAEQLGYPCHHSETLVIGPDGYAFKVLPKTDRQEAFQSVCLKSDDLQQVKAFWVGVLGMTIFHQTDTLVRVGFKSEQVALEFIYDPSSKLDFKEATGRIAFACERVDKIHQRIKQTGDHLETDILVLPTEGKADVVVVILKDRDGYEICFVEDIAFYQLATPTYDIIDWQSRAKLGGDRPPKQKKLKQQQQEQQKE